MQINIKIDEPDIIICTFYNIFARNIYEQKTIQCQTA